MKRFPKIILPAFLLLLLLGICHADQKSEVIKAFNFGYNWKTLPFDAKIMYLVGYTDGLHDGILDAKNVLASKMTDMKFVSSGKFNQAYLMHNPLSSKKDDVKLISAMDYLYDDPENTYIDYKYILELARAKIDGKPIEKKLLEYRKLNESLPK